VGFVRLFAMKSAKAARVLGRINALPVSLNPRAFARKI
jgi:hypothetical protein